MSAMQSAALIPKRTLRFARRLLSDVEFIHINKTGGSSVEEALGLPFRHQTAAEALAVIGRRRWDRRLTFSVVRNPWDRAVSQYHFRVRTGQTGLDESGISFTEWLRLVHVERDPAYRDVPRMFMPQLDWLTVNTAIPWCNECVGSRPFRRTCMRSHGNWGVLLAGCRIASVPPGVVSGVLLRRRNRADRPRL